jgi:hypothetical protein
MCTVLLRLTGESLLLGAVRDEFLERPWDPPAEHWPGLWGGRDRTAGGTWLAVRPERPAVAALLNGVRRPAPESGTRPTRGELPLDVLREHGLPDVTDYDGFHVLLGTPTSATVWSWDGADLVRADLTGGDHIIVNHGVDTVDDPLVPHFQPLLAETATPVMTPVTGRSTVDAWGPWVTLLAGDGLPPDDPRALVVRTEFEGRIYGSGSASLVALTADGVRYDFTPTPAHPRWTPVLTRERAPS